MKKENKQTDQGHRRHYDEDFKASALQMVSSGRSVPDVARVLGIHENVLYRWRKAAEEKSAPTGSEADELAQLKRYCQQLEQERDILKKALSIFRGTT
jgi:transposase